METPTNPLLKLCDIKAISNLAKDLGIITVVDNTFASPYFQKPLKLGADIVIHSTTKYISGHSDVVGGAVMLSGTEIYEKMKFIQNAIGTVPSPFDCFLVLRGIKTLSVRMEKHASNAQKIAEFLNNHLKVEQVYYLGIKTHPQYDLAKKQMSGFSGMLSFEIKGTIKKAIKFLENLEIFYLAESLGGVESLIELPALMTHASLSREERARIGIKDTLIRISVGIEDSNDLIYDLEQAFEAI